MRVLSAGGNPNYFISKSNYQEYKHDVIMAMRPTSDGEYEVLIVKFEFEDIGEAVIHSIKSTFDLSTTSSLL